MARKFLIITLLMSVFIRQEGKATDLISNRPLTLKSIERDHPLPDCKKCHQKKSISYKPIQRPLTRAHTDIHVEHSEAKIWCDSCHDVFHSNKLHNYGNQTTTFADSSGVCGRCHANKYERWREGLHGKRVGGWKQPSLQYQCIHCHAPHQVKYPSTIALPPPKKPKLEVEKIGGAH